MICVGAVAAGALASTGVASASAGTISEAGSSLVYPIASVWASHYPGGTVNTAAGGSSAGIKDVQTGQVDIGASDAPMTPSQFGTGSANYVQIPWGLSATGVGYNLPGIGTGLKLTGTVLAKIYTGKITSWSDPSILALNKNFASKLKKDGKITPVFRSDGSGDSYAFQNYMAHAAPGVWVSGYGTSFPGPSNGVGENGNAGVAGEVKSNKGTIGYISGAYLLQQHISVAGIRNQAGSYELPNISSILNAAASNTTLTSQGSGFTGDSIVNARKGFKTAYPISTYTYAIVSQSDKNVSSVQSFLDWVISKTGGQQYGVSLDFAPLPAKVITADQALINSL
jgi:phosphate transport system substrate-binding protein